MRRDQAFFWGGGRNIFSNKTKKNIQDTVDFILWHGPVAVVGPKIFTMAEPPEEAVGFRTFLATSTSKDPAKRVL